METLVRPDQQQKRIKTPSPASFGHFSFFFFFLSFLFSINIFRSLKKNTKSFFFIFYQRTNFTARSIAKSSAGKIQFLHIKNSWESLQRFSSYRDAFKNVNRYIILQVQAIPIERKENDLQIHARQGDANYISTERSLIYVIDIR